LCSVIILLPWSIWNLLMLSYMHFQGDLHQYLKDKGALNPLTAVNFALDIARYSHLMSLTLSAYTLCFTVFVLRTNPVNYMIWDRE
jgi:hypothetical protein